MKASCDVISDLIPLVKDRVASEDSVKLVSEHLKTCENCKSQFESDILTSRHEIDDKRVIASIKKKLFLVMSALLLIGAFLGIVFNQKTSLNIMSLIIAVISIVLIGTLIFKSNLKGDDRMNRFFEGKAIGTIILFAILGVYLLLKYGLHLFS